MHRSDPSPRVAQILLASLLAGLAAAALGGAWYLRSATLDEIENGSEVLESAYGDAGITFAGETLLLVGAGVLAGLCVIAAALAFWPRRLSLGVIRFVGACGLIAALLVLIYVIAATSTAESAWAARDSALGTGEMFFWRLRWSWPVLPLVVLGCLVLVHGARRVTLRLFVDPTRRSRALGDRILENLRTGGDDPRYRRSMLQTVVLYLAVLFGPLLIGMLFRGCVTPYRVPHGSGDPVVAMVTRVKPKPKPKEKFILNPDATVWFDVPDLDESDLAEQVDQMTQETYVADTEAVHGKLGAGGGKQGGWPWGDMDGKVRFIRLKYNGPDWDDGMRNGRADAAFLAEFRKITGMDSSKVAREGEAHEISLLEAYPKGQAPPFVYMTGSGHIRTSSRERQVLRDYLLEGGMLFADAGSPNFHRHFMGLMRHVFPDKRLIEIADDDVLFRNPFTFPSGPPELWHHGGSDCMGIKHKGRWIVFYHPGDVNDAWKVGASDISPNLRNQAFHIGVNVVWYSFTKYGQIARKYRN
ncbi:MAG: DUF4159 domain-containing protein [Phycisphaerae bacterium]